MSRVHHDRNGFPPQDTAPGASARGAPAALDDAYGGSGTGPHEDDHRPPKDIVFKPSLSGPPQSIEVAELYSKSSEPDLYLNLTKWYPGWMSAPHFYETDRVCVVLSGTWWATSGDDFDPNSTVPVPAGSFVRRVARSRHYDGVKAGEPEPVVIAICGIGPITFHPVDPTKPGVRKV